MTVGIYCIEHIESGKKYVGKSIEIERRLSYHKYYLTRKEVSKGVNRHLWSAVQKYGWDAFKTYVLQEFSDVDEDLIGSAELDWMDKLQTCDRRFGYNLRRDTRTGMLTHEETRKALSDAQKRRYCDIDFGDHEREMTGERSRKHWAEMPPEHKLELGQRISERMNKYHYAQCDKHGVILVIWRSIREIKAHYPQIHIPNVHSVSDGHKPTYMGYIWEKLDPAKSDPNLLYSGSAPAIKWDEPRSHLPSWWVRCVDPDAGEIELFESVSEAAAAHGVTYGYMSNCVNGRIDNIRGYLFFKVEPPYISLQKERRGSKRLIFEDDDIC